jgi:hypothetical protein
MLSITGVSACRSGRNAVSVCLTHPSHTLLIPTEANCSAPAPNQTKTQPPTLTFVIPTGAKRSGGICSAPQPLTKPRTTHPHLPTGSRFLLRLFGAESSLELSGVGAHCRSLRFGRDDKGGLGGSGGVWLGAGAPQVGFVNGWGALQIPPLRFAPVGMTNRATWLGWGLVRGGRTAGWICQGWGRTADPSAPLRSGRDDKVGYVVRVGFG